jgi:hypothetical protein
MYHILILFSALTLLLNGCAAPLPHSTCVSDAVKYFHLSPEAAENSCSSQPEFN